MEWKTVERPGYFGKKKDEIHGQYDEKYGKGNWRIAWTFSEVKIPFELACLIYEDSYYHDSFNREKLWKELAKTAREVYDLEEADIASSFDYKTQNGSATHLQDIAARRVVSRRGWKFQGDELVRTRGHKSYWGDILSPGKVPFHLPNQIVEPHIEGWWDKNSVEDFYQSNKIVQVKD